MLQLSGFYCRRGSIGNFLDFGCARDDLGRQMQTGQSFLGARCSASRIPGVRKKSRDLPIRAGTRANVLRSRTAIGRKWLGHC